AGTAEQTVKKVPSSRHVRMDGTHTGKFGAESVRAALRRVRGSAPNFVPRGIPGGRNFCPAQQAEMGPPWSVALLRHADPPARRMRAGGSGDHSSGGVSSAGAELPAWLSASWGGASGVAVIWTSRSAAIYTTMVLPASTMAPGSTLQATTQPEA